MFQTTRNEKYSNIKLIQEFEKNKTNSTNKTTVP